MHQRREELEAALGSVVASLTPISGGDINEAFRLELSDGRVVFVKSHDRGVPGMFPAEARGLQWLAEAGEIRVPGVIAFRDEDENSGGFLLLEWIDFGSAGSGFDERLGRALARLHRYGAPCFGLAADNFIGDLHQSNNAHPTWAEFYGRERLEPQVRLARNRGLFSETLSGDAKRLIDRLPEIVGPEEAPARLHGDLWGGNHGADSSGAPVIFDPAAYGGNREVDLAMMRLFGGYSERCFSSYTEEYPLTPGWRERVSLYQLYPVLVHVNLFGSSYVRQAQSIIGRYL